MPNNLKRELITNLKVVKDYSSKSIENTEVTSMKFWKILMVIIYLPIHISTRMHCGLFHFSIRMTDTRTFLKEEVNKNVFHNSCPEGETQKIGLIGS